MVSQPGSYERSFAFWIRIWTSPPHRATSKPGEAAPGPFYLGTVRNVFERTLPLAEQETIREPLIRMCLSYLDMSGGYPINPAVVATDPEALFEFLIRGQGIQLTNPHLVHTAVASGDVLRILPEWSGPSATLYAVRAGGRVQPLKVRVFIDYLTEHLDEVLQLS